MISAAFCSFRNKSGKKNVYRVCVLLYEYQAKNTDTQEWWGVANILTSFNDGYKKVKTHILCYGASTRNSQYAPSSLDFSAFQLSTALFPHIPTLTSDATPCLLPHPTDNSCSPSPCLCLGDIH